MVKRYEVQGAAIDAARAAKKKGIRYFVAGMFAGNYWLGEEARRATFDADIGLLSDQPAPIVSELRRRGWVIRKERGAATHLRQPGHPFRIDLFRTGTPLVGPKGGFQADALVEEIWGRSTPRKIRGENVRLARPVDVIALKCVSIALGYKPEVHAEDIRLIAKHTNVTREELARVLKPHRLDNIYRQCVAALLPEKDRKKS